MPRPDAIIARVVNGVAMDQPRIAPARRRYCFTMGRICEEKGFHVAIEATSLAGAPLLIAGHVYPFQAHVEYFGRAIVPRLGSSTPLHRSGPARTQTSPAARRALDQHTRGGRVMVRQVRAKRVAA